MITYASFNFEAPVNLSKCTSRFTHSSMFAVWTSFCVQTSGNKRAFWSPPLSYLYSDHFEVGSHENVWNNEFSYQMYRFWVLAQCLEKNADSQIEICSCAHLTMCVYLEENHTDSQIETCSCAHFTLLVCVYLAENHSFEAVISDHTKLFSFTMRNIRIITSRSKFNFHSATIRVARRERKLEREEMRKEFWESWDAAAFVRLLFLHDLLQAAPRNGVDW